MVEVDGMHDQDDQTDQLREQFAGRYVAWLGDEVFASAETYDELRDHLDTLPIDQGKLAIGYLRRTDVVYI
jgi:hypothetical protein